VEIIKTDVVVVGAGGGGLRAAIAIAEADPNLSVALISKVYPMRSHTCAAEGGAAGVAQDHDTLDNHFNDTVSGGDWLCDQDVVEFFVERAPRELTQMEHWGCPWSRNPDGKVAVRKFGGMKIARTWYAADKTGFHMLHTLFQTSIKYSSIHRYDEFFCTDLIVDEDRCQGILTIEIRTGEPKLFLAKSVIIAAGGAGRVYPFTTNGGIKTGDGMSMAYRAGVPLQDMEFVQYHPTGLPGTGILVTEGCRGEGGILTNKDGYRYLQDYELGPVSDPSDPQPKTMELGPRDRLSQAFWQEDRKGKTIPTEWGTNVVHLDLRHLGEKKIDERLPFVRDLASSYVNADPVYKPIPVRPVVHYTMGGIKTDVNGATPLAGLFAVGECASSGLHGANRLGSNSLTELLVLGRTSGEAAVRHLKDSGVGLLDDAKARDLAGAGLDKIMKLHGRDNKGTESIAAIRNEMADAMEKGVGIYRIGDEIQQTVDKIRELRERYTHVKVGDTSKVFNTEWLIALELGALLDVAFAMAKSAVERKESRGSHQRLDGFEARDDKNYLAHTLAYYNGTDDPRIEYADVKITKSQPAKRVYGGAK
jgi:fumarate reductase flavoprotein subunit